MTFRTGAGQWAWMLERVSPVENSEKAFFLAQEGSGYMIRPRNPIVPIWEIT